MNATGFFRLLGELVLCAVTSAAIAQSGYPSRPIRLIVPLTAGGGVDLGARITALRLSEQLGQPVVVENRAGGGGTIGSAAVAQAAPDGYTLLFFSTSAVVNAVVLANLKYDPGNDFARVTQVAQFPMMIVVSPDTPAANLKEFIALLRSNPGRYTYGSSGIGTFVHIATALFTSLARVDMLHIPYKGLAAVNADLFAGRVTMLMDSVGQQAKNIAAGRVRALAVTSKTRSITLPGVPTAAESGVPDFDLSVWTAIFAPVRTPKAIIDLLAAETAKAMKHPDTVRRMKELDADTEGVGSTPEAMEQLWRQEMARYGKIAKDSDIKID
ncbi:MAG: tripartite tricarboxylate transporter substrate binding protein [Betaproteobacteria bacterium]|nr:tripartite tricarboxylate transporter substrate binding protein [Betaproteobacteria bacterium]